MPNFNEIIFKDNENLKNQLNFNFLSNNVKGLQSSKKRLKLFNFLKNKIGPKGILFLQETHFFVETEKKWTDDFKDKIYYSHGKTNYENGWYFCNITKSGWFGKRLSRKKFLNNHFLMSLQKEPYKDILKNRCF